MASMRIIAALACPDADIRRDMAATRYAARQNKDGSIVASASTMPIAQGG
jgi:hypothetical protein